MPQGTDIIYCYSVKGLVFPSSEFPFLSLDLWLAAARVKSILQQDGKKIFFSNPESKHPMQPYPAAAPLWPCSTLPPSLPYSPPIGNIQWCPQMKEIQGRHFQPHSEILGLEFQCWVKKFLFFNWHKTIIQLFCFLLCQFLCFIFHSICPFHVSCQTFCPKLSYSFNV